jgi:ketosteroid isomerase-like protein
MRAGLLLAGAFVAIQGCASGGVGVRGADIERLILGLEEQRREAQMKGDWQTIQSLNAPDMVDIGANGAIRSTAQNSEAMRSGTLKFASADASDQTVRIYGDVAVVTGIGHRTGTFNGAPFEQRFRFTRIYVRQGSSWRAVHAQNTTLQENNR